MWLAAMLAGLLVTAWPATAADPGSLRSDLGRLQAELAALRQVELAQLQEPALRTAALEVRLSRLEEELRRLTGRIEEVEYAQRQASARTGRPRCRPGRPAAAAAAPPRRRGAAQPGSRATAAPAVGVAGPRIDHRARRRGASGLRPGHDPRGCRARAARRQGADPAGAEPGRSRAPRPGCSPKVRMRPTRARSICCRPASGAMPSRSSPRSSRTTRTTARAPTASVLAGRDLLLPQGLPDRRLGVRAQLPDLRRCRAARAGQPAQARHVAGRDGRP